MNYKISDVFKNKLEINQHYSGWVEITHEGKSIDESGDGGFSIETAIALVVSVNHFDDFINLLYKAQSSDNDELKKESINIINKIKADICKTNS